MRFGLTDPSRPTELATLQNSFGGGIRYFRIGGILYVQVNVNRNPTPAAGTVIAVLPVGYRPGYNFDVVANGNNGTLSVVSFRPSGNIEFSSGTTVNSLVCLTSFPLAV